MVAPDIDPRTQCRDHAVTGRLADAGTAHPGTYGGTNGDAGQLSGTRGHSGTNPDLRTGDGRVISGTHEANTRAHGGPDTNEDRPDTGVHPRYTPDRCDGGTHGDTYPGTTVDSDLHPTPTECLGSSQSNRRCGEMTQTKFK